MNSTQVTKPLLTGDTYQGCMQDLNLSVPSDMSVRVDEVYDDPIHAEGVPETTSKAVTVTLTSVSGTTEETSTMHAILHDGKWKWVLKPQDVVDYKNGTCPT